MTFRGPSILVCAWLLLPLPGRCVRAADDLLGGNEDLADDVLEEFEGPKSALAKLRGKPREAAVGKILADPKPANVPDLVQILKDAVDGMDSQEKAARALCRFGGPEVMSAGKRLLNDPSPQRKAMGTRLVAASGQKDAASILVAASRSMGNHADVTYGLCRAFALLQDKAAVPWLAARAAGADETLARLAMCLCGELSGFRQVLADHESISAKRQKQAVVWDWAWQNQWLTPAEKANAVKSAERMDEYLALFKRLLGRCRADEMRLIVESMKTGEGHLANAVYQAIATFVKAENASSFLPLLESPAPEIREEAARAIAGSGAQGWQATLKEASFAMAAGSSTSERAAAMRLADLLPPEDGRKLLAGGLADTSAFVVQEAMDAIRGHRIGGLEGDVEKLLKAGTWNHEPGVVHAAEMIVAAVTSSR